MTATCPGPCQRCNEVRELRRDELCFHCGTGVDRARRRDFDQDERAKSAQAFDTLLGLQDLEAAR
jgi:hypothetical protein